MENTGRLLQSVRMRTNMTQAELSRRTGFHVSQINHVENGRRTPPKGEVLQRWLNAIDASAADRYLIGHAAGTQLAINALTLVDEFPGRTFAIKVLAEISLCRDEELAGIETRLFMHLRSLLAGKNSMADLQSTDQSKEAA